MNNYIRLLFLILISSLGYFKSAAQCHVSSLIINTAYNPSTGLAIAAGSSGSPSLDPHWIIEHATSDIPGAGSPGSPAYVIPIVSGAWAANPAADPGGWISVINSNTYDTYPDSVYNMTLCRPFRMCSADSITFNLEIADDNWLSLLSVDTTTLGFSQAAGAVSAYFNTFHAFSQTVYLPEGTHNLCAVVNNWPTSSYSSNPTGLDIYGTVSSATGSVSLVYEADPACSSYFCTAPPACNPIVMTDSIHICGDSSITLSASVAAPDSVINVRWYPPTGLSDTTILNPVLTSSSTSTTYYVTVTSIIPGNLAVNGSFTYGNTGFNSGYTFLRTASSPTYPGQYGVGTNPTAYNSVFPTIGDHTTGSGKMMVIDGSTTSGTSIWCESIPVAAGAYYDFSFWLANLGSGYSTSDAGLVVTVNGTTIGTTAIGSGTGGWLQHQDVWYSGTDTIANICITDSNTTYVGNDFALDDISLQKMCIVSDSVYVAINPNPIVNLGNDTTICGDNPLTLHSSLTYTSPVYLWSTGSTASSISTATTGSYWLSVNQAGCIGRDTINVNFKPIPIVNLGDDTGLCSGTLITANILPGAGISYIWSTGAITPSIVISATGTYWVTIDSNGCKNSDTINISIYPDFTVDLGPDTSYCQTSSVTLSSSTASTYSSGAIYLWSTGATSPSIIISSSGTYWLQVTQGVCTRSDTITVSITPDYAVDLGDDTLICHPGADILQSSYTYTGATYLWNTGATTPSISVTATGSYWLDVFEAGCIRSDTVNVSIVYDSLFILNHDTAICKGNYIQVFANSHAFGATYTYQWIPTAGIALSTSLNPVITPDTSAMYYLTAFTTGCPSVQDSLYIDVQPTPLVYIGGNRQVCQYDTLHLVPSVTPGWYPGYIYSWTPSAPLDDTNTATVVFTASTTTNLYLTVTTTAGCTGIDSAQIIVHTGNFAIAGPDVFICPHDSAQLSVTAPDGTSFHWSPSLYLSDSTVSTPWVHPISTVKYNIIATSSFGCTDTASISVTVYPSAVIFLPDSVTIYPGESYQISPQTNCTSFAWFPPAGLNLTNISNPVATPEVSTKYIVNGTTDFGCKTVDSIDVIFDPGALIALPNAFTPGSGVNNTLKLLLRGEASLNYFRIYDRWGVLVFETNNMEQGWDGTYKGAPQPYGVYVYELQAATNQGVLFSKHGNVTLIR